MSRWREEEGSLTTVGSLNPARLSLSSFSPFPAPSPVTACGTHTCTRAGKLAGPQKHREHRHLHFTGENTHYGRGPIIAPPPRSLFGVTRARYSGGRDKRSDRDSPLGTHLFGGPPTFDLAIWEQPAAISPVVLRESLLRDRAASEECSPVRLTGPSPEVSFSRFPRTSSLYCRSPIILPNCQKSIRPLRFRRRCSADKGDNKARSLILGATALRSLATRPRRPIDAC